MHQVTQARLGAGITICTAVLLVVVLFAVLDPGAQQGKWLPSGFNHTAGLIFHTPCPPVTAASCPPAQAPAVPAPAAPTAPVSGLSWFNASTDEASCGGNDGRTLREERNRERYDTPRCMVWHALQFADARLRMAAAQPMDDVQQLAAKLNQGKGRGIVTCAGTRRQLANAFANLLALRQSFGDAVPMELWHRSDEADTILEVAHIFRMHVPNLEFINASTIKQVPWHRHYDVGGDATHRQEVRGLKDSDKFYAFKLFATYYTSFDEVIFLDSDSLLLQDPAALFKDADYQTYGNRFNTDLVYVHHSYNYFSEGAYLIHGLAPPWEGDPDWQEVEAGQFIFHRLKLADVLEYVWFLNVNGCWQFHYNLGDKDTSRLAFALADRVNMYNEVAVKPGVWLSRIDDPAPRFLEQKQLAANESVYAFAAIAHSGPSGQPLYAHRLAAGKLGHKGGSYWRLDALSIPMPNYKCEKQARKRQMIFGKNSAVANDTEVLADDVGNHLNWLSGRDIQWLSATAHNTSGAAFADWEIQKSGDCTKPIPVAAVDRFKLAAEVIGRQAEAFALYQHAAGYAKPVWLG